MKKILSFILLFFVFVVGFGQDVSMSVFEPINTPPSPESSSLTKYGDIAINESTGKAIFNVPLYTYKAGNLSLPISINYLGNGVKINALSTWTGVNWTLNAGGVITRKVYQNPDELSIRIFENNILVNIDNTNPNVNNPTLYYYFNSISYDTQPDIFTFSFMNYSGSFYLDENFNPVSMNGDVDLKIEIGGSQSSPKDRFIARKEFIITAPDGIKYYFGFNETQKTELEQVPHNQIHPNVVTSFFLYRIEHPTNGIINLEYQYTNFHKINLSSSQSIIKYYNPILPETIEINEEEYPLYTRLESEDLQNSQISIRVDRGVFLANIWSPNTDAKIFFNIIDENGRFNFDKVLDNITIQSQSSIVNKIRFAYLHNRNDFGISQRFTLKRVVFFSNINLKKYVFEYKNFSILPNRFSYSQDHLGYFNATNNNTLLQFDLLYDTTSTCDRDSNFETRITGALTKIIYPTGGYTEIEYEAPLTKEIETKNVFLETYYNNCFNHVDVLLDGYHIGGNFIGPDGNTNEESVFKTQNVEINVDLYSTSKLVLHTSEMVNIDIIDVTNINSPITTHKRFVITDPDLYTNYDGEYYTYTNTFNHQIIKDHKYIIRLNIDITDIPVTRKLGAFLKFNYIKGYKLKDGEGIRVKRISDYTKDSNAPTNIKRYYYTKAINLNKNKLDYVPVYKKPAYLSDYYYLMKHQDDYIVDDPMLYDKYKLLATFHYDPEDILSVITVGHKGGKLLSSPLNYDDTDSYKNVVISYGGDNFENGGVEKSFSQQLYPPIKLINTAQIFTLKGFDILNSYKEAPWNLVFHGQLLKETFLKNNNGTLYKLKEKSFLKYYNEESFLFGYLADSYRNVWFGHCLSTFTIGRYRLSERKLIAKTIRTKHYIEPYPLVEDVLGNLPDENNFRIITTFSHKEYNSVFKGLPTEIIINDDVKIKNTYLDNFNSLSNLTTTQINANNELLNKHIISTPIQTEKYKVIGDNENLLETKRILYKNTNNKIVPEKMQISKGINNLETRIIYHKYDNKGNPLDLRKANGRYISYIWGYNKTQPIAKLVNIAYGNIPQAELNALLNFDYSAGTEADLLTKLNDLRNALPSYVQLTTMTYKPLIGVSTITDPKGDMQTYHYGDFNRLEFVKDNDGNILSKNEYHYRIEN